MNRLRLRICLIALLTSVAQADTIIAWEFDSPQDINYWVPNAHLANVEQIDGKLVADAVDSDPYFSCLDLALDATPWQYVIVRIRASESGQGELFWSGTREGPHGGLSQEKSTPFTVTKGNWNDVVIYPFWHTEGSIDQLRLDLYNGAHYEIDSITIGGWNQESDPSLGEPQTDPWRDWHSVPGSDVHFFRGTGDYSLIPFAIIQARAEIETSCAFVWATRGRPGMHEEPFTVKKGDWQYFNLEMAGNPNWRDTVAVGLRMPAGAFVGEFGFSQTPQGPPVIQSIYFGMENGAPRAGRPASLMLQVENTGGKPSILNDVELFPVEGAMLQSDVVQSMEPIEMGDRTSVRWTVAFSNPGTYQFSAGRGGATYVSSPIHVLPARRIEPLAYVPPPLPVHTDADILAYYFPGWDADAKWDPVRGTAPQRKPILGYYDESSPEIVDWQIKWSVENGIDGFLVDWYWVKGSQHLTHWFDAYRKARYRDQLKVAIMWANHNPPNTHSREDWRNVTREWIDNYFSLPAYYRIGNRPAIYLWDPRNLFNDLGGTEEVKAALDESQAMARAAGYEGIVFIAMGYGFAASDLARMRAEGFEGVTTYHEWGDANTPGTGVTKPFQIVADTVETSWKARHDAAFQAGLAYYPVADTGWDSRPWHGGKSYVLDGRTPEHFRTILGKAKDFLGRTGGNTIVLGPMNEWGEGSYIEPNTEYGFAMMNAIREVFASQPADGWPENITPEDVALGPYDYPKLDPVTSWEFDKGLDGWRAMMGLGDVRVQDGAMMATTSSADPAFVVELRSVRAKDFSSLTINMQLEGPLETGETLQVFWSNSGGPTNESASVHVPLAQDGKMHTYSIPVVENPRWRGRISLLRLDPCNRADVKVTVENVRLE